MAVEEGNAAVDDDTVVDMDEVGKASPFTEMEGGDTEPGTTSADDRRGLTS